MPDVPDRAADSTTDYTALPRDLARLIAARRWSELAASTAWPDAEMVAPEVADRLLELATPDRVLFFRALPREVATEAFAVLGGETRDALLRDLSDPETARLLATSTRMIAPSCWVSCRDAQCSASSTCSRRTTWPKRGNCWATPRRASGDS